jgi:hypothetical protein
MDTRTFSTAENHGRYWSGRSIAEIRRFLDEKDQG